MFFCSLLFSFLFFLHSSNETKLSINFSLVRQWTRPILSVFILGEMNLLSRIELKLPILACAEKPEA